MTYRGRPVVPDGVAPGEVALGPDDGAGLCCHRIADNLFLGSREAAERPAAVLRALGIDTVVNCTRDGAADGVPCAHAEAGLEYCRVGVHDNESADISSYLSIASGLIAARRGAGSGVLVHCQMGRSRSATITIAALMVAEGLSRDAAYLRVKGARPMAEPNQGFWEQLAQFEAELAPTAAAGSEAAADAAAAPVIDEMWLQRILAKFEFSHCDVSIGLPTYTYGVKLVVVAGVDFWLGRGCDPSTSRWLHAIVQHAVSVGGDTIAGAVEGLRATILSPEYMTVNTQAIFRCRCL